MSDSIRKLNSMAPSSPSIKEFKPTDDELLRLFLYNKVHGKPLPDNATILECDLYGERNPSEIWEEFAESNAQCGKDLYIFTKLKRKSGASARSVRTIGSGHWEGEDVGKIIAAPNDKNKPLGMKKRFRFEKSGTDQDGRWIMHEYSLDPSLLSNSSAINNQVLCRFRKNLAHNNRKRSMSKQDSVGLLVNEPKPNQSDDTCSNPEKTICSEGQLELSKHMKTSKSKTKKKQETRVNANKTRTVVLGIAATKESDINNKDNKVSMGKDICQEPKSHPESGGKTDVVENTTINESKTDEEDGDLTMSWPELFAQQLRSGCSNQEEEELHMLPNTFWIPLQFEMPVNTTNFVGTPKFQLFVKQLLGLGETRSPSLLSLPKSPKVLPSQTLIEIRKA